MKIESVCFFGKAIQIISILETEHQFLLVQECEKPERRSQPPRLVIQGGSYRLVVKTGPSALVSLAVCALNRKSAIGRNELRTVPAPRSVGGSVVQFHRTKIIVNTDL